MKFCLHLCNCLVCLFLLFFFVVAWFVCLLHSSYILFFYLVFVQLYLYCKKSASVQECTSVYTCVTKACIIQVWKWTPLDKVRGSISKLVHGLVHTSVTTRLEHSCTLTLYAMTSAIELIHSTLLHSTWLNITLLWLYFTLLHSTLLYHGSTSLYMTLHYYTIATLHSTSLLPGV